MIMPDKEFLSNEIHNGIYCHDLKTRYLVLVNTVEENQQRFSRRELSEARDSRRAFLMFGYPSKKTFDNMVNTTKNSLVETEYVWSANTIYGYDVPTLKGETIRQQPKQVKNEYIEVPESLW